MSPAEKARRPSVQKSEFHWFKRRLCLRFLGGSYCWLSVLDFGLWLGAKRIVIDAQLKFRLLERSKRIVFHVESTNGLKFTSHCKFLANHKVGIVVGSEQPVGVKKLDCDCCILGDAVIQGHSKAFTIIFRLKRTKIGNASNEGNALEISVRHVS